MSWATDPPENYQDVGTIDAEDLRPVVPETWRLIDDAELMLLPDPEFIVDGVIPEASVGALIAPPGLGKTTLAVDLMFSIATGLPWFGHEVRRRGASVYVAAEDPSGFKLRVRARKQAARMALDTPIGIYCFPEPVDMRDAASVARFSHFLGRSFESGDAPRRLLVIDTYSASNPGAAENSSEDTTTAMSHAQRWRDDLDTAVLLVHHTNAAGTRERGHSAMRGSADFMIAMHQNDDVVIVECSKQRNASPFEALTLKLLPVGGTANSGCVFRLASDVLSGPELSLNQAKLLDVLKTTFDRGEGATKSEWQRSCPDVAERTFHRVCTVLVERGLVVKTGTHYRMGKGAK